MSWEYLIAKKIKESGNKARRDAVLEASAYIGTIESQEPLIVTILDGAGLYEKDEIVQSKVFKNYSAETKRRGRKVIVLPVNGLDKIAVLDIVEGGY